MQGLLWKTIRAQSDDACEGDGSVQFGEAPGANGQAISVTLDGLIIIDIALLNKTLGIIHVTSYSVSRFPLRECGVFSRFTHFVNIHYQTTPKHKRLWVV